MDKAPTQTCADAIAGARQPTRLFPLAVSETMERFAFFGMQTLLLLYLSEKLLPERGRIHVHGLRLLLSGLGIVAHPSDLRQTACLAMALLAGSTNLAPVVLGPIAERLLGTRRAIVCGGAVMAGGYLLMCLQPWFLVGMLLLVVGVGCFRGNLACEVGALYGPGDRRREQGFRLLNLAMNIGITAAPLACGALAQAYGWRFGFMGAALGMAASLAVFLAATPRRGSAGATPRRAASRMTRDEAWRATGLALNLCLLGVGLLGCEQIYDAYLGWAHDTLRMEAFGRPVPVAWLVSLDTLLSILALALVGPLWRLWRRRLPEPDEPVKIALGFALVALSYLCLIPIQKGAEGRGAAALVVCFHALNGLGYANVIPVTLALCARRAPEAARSLLMGLFYAQFGLSLFLAGAMARLVGEVSYPVFWGLHAAVMAAVGLLSLAMSWWGARLQTLGARSSAPLRPLGGGQLDHAAAGTAG